MPQVFPPISNTLARLSVVGAVGGLMGAGLAAALFSWSPYLSRVGMAREQPVPFSHQHHVRDLGLDCRFCHAQVQTAAFAGMPDTRTCMTCHSQIWRDSPMLEPVRASWRRGEPLAWARVHDLADFVYFDHSIHVRQGVGCVTCHGRVDRMPLTRKEQSLHMQWCLACHRQPERFLRPREHVFDLAWIPPADDPSLGSRLAREYKIHKSQLTNCSVCHR